MNFFYKPQKGFFQFEIIINVLVQLFQLHFSTYVLGLVGHYIFLFLSETGSVLDVRIEMSVLIYCVNYLTQHTLQGLYIINIVKYYSFKVYICHRHTPGGIQNKLPPSPIYTHLVWTELAHTAGPRPDWYRTGQVEK